MVELSALDLIDLVFDLAGGPLLTVLVGAHLDPLVGIVRACLEQDEETRRDFSEQIHGLSALDAAELRVETAAKRVQHFGHRLARRHPHAARRTSRAV